MMVNKLNQILRKRKREIQIIYHKILMMLNLNKLTIRQIKRKFLNNLKMYLRKSKTLIEKVLGMKTQS